MSIPYQPLTSAEKSAHLTNRYPSGVLASGEANFFDFKQPVLNVAISPPPLPSSIFSPSGTSFLFNNKLSNGVESKASGINDFKIFNPYIHYISSPKANQGVIDPSPYAFKIDFSTQFNEVATKFNAYSEEYRKIK